MTNLWILTEERPKKEVLAKILEKISLDKGFSHEFRKLIIKPILDGDKFTFTYELLGFVSDQIERIYIKSVSGSGSFVDFLIFLQDDEPTINDEPLYAIEETKTDDSESRNTGVYQRCSKFVYVDLYYPSCKKIMLYNLKINQKEEPTETNIFGTRMLLNLGVEIMGKNLSEEVFQKFEDIDELIEFKDNMRSPPGGNVPILLKKSNNSIEISGRLWKANSLSHDPNMGALSLISKTLRELGWENKIIITQHGLSQKHLTGRNKFVRIANEIGISLKGLKLPQSNLPEDYWHYEQNSEKIGTIFLHLVLDELKNVKGIYENHAGCERGYFYTQDNIPVALHKYIKNDKKRGKIPKIPDLIVADNEGKLILNLEGKTQSNLEEGLEDIKLFDTIEEEYIEVYYPDFEIKRGVVLFGGDEEEIENEKVLFLLNKEGKMILSENTPEIISKAIDLIKNLNKKE